MSDHLYYTDRPDNADARGFADYRPALVESGHSSVVYGHSSIAH